MSKMEFPYGNTNHHQHHHHHRRDEREDLDYPPPPPPAQPYPPSPYYGGQQNYDQYPPPPPQVTHVYHSSHIGGENDQFPPPPHFAPNHFPPQQDFNNYPRPPSPTHDFNSYSSHSSYPPTQGFNNYSDTSSYPPPAPPQTTVQHVSHEGGESDGPHHFRPHMPSFIHNHTHHQGSQPPNAKPAVRIYTKARSDYSLAVRNGKVILAPSDPSDPFQHWIKDERYSTKVKDEQGYPSFALINKGSGEAIKHSIGATHPVQLIPYNSDVLDESVLWTLSKDLGDGFRTIRMVNNIRLNVDAFNGDKNHGVHDGTIIVLWEWNKGDNQRWTVVPY